MGSGPGSPFGLEDKAPLNLLDVKFWRIYTDSPHPHKQETRGVDTAQATSVFPWWLLNYLSGQETVEAKGDLVSLKSGGNPEKSQVRYNEYTADNMALPDCPWVVPRARLPTLFPI